jgi:hypothetical protein
MRKVIIGTACFATTLIGFGATVASAAEPAKQGCVGESVAANAQTIHPYGAFISSVAPQNIFGTLGDAVQAVQAGQVPDDLYNNTCN